MSAAQYISRPSKATRKRNPEFLRTAAEEDLAAINEELRTINLVVKENIQLSDRRHLQLRRSAADLDTIFTSFNIALIAVTQEGFIRHFNAEAERLFNLLPGDIGKPVRHLNLGAGGFDIRALISRAIASGQSIREEYLDEKGRWRALRVRPSMDASNSVDGAVLVITHIDDLKRTQKRPQQAVRTVSCRTEAVTSIAAELTPSLMSMLGWVNLLRSGVLNASQMDRVLDILERNAEEQRHMIEALLPSDA
jgi:two-component system CheB/CheR fusion protein